MFMRVALLQIGLPIDITNWIMGCVTLSNFWVLVNGMPTSFFITFTGNQEGFPLSHFLSLICT